MKTNEFISGEFIAQKFNVSRTTVSEWINQLLAYGLTIHRVKGKGYRLTEPLQLLDQDRIERYLESVLNQVTVADITAETESTNKIALSSEYNDDRWQLFATEYQRSGRGRRGREWKSPFGSNLLFSLGKKTSWDSATLYGASLIAGMSIVKSIQEYSQSPVKIKWPNDIYIRDCKVAGILCEIQGNPTDEALLVVGVGLNLFTFPTLDEKATTSLNAHSHFELDRNQILGQIVASVASSLNGFEGFQESHMKQWAQMDYLYGKDVELHKGKSIIRGRAKGIDQQGQLRLLTSPNRISLFNSGEVSVRW